MSKIVFAENNPFNSHKRPKKVKLAFKKNQRNHFLALSGEYEGITVFQHQIAETGKEF